jgi:lipoprotein-releasing system permease protein
MGYPFDLARRYMGSRKRAFVSLGTAFAILGVAIGVAALSIVMSVTGGFQKEFRDKVLGVNAHVLVLKYSTDFREYRTIMEQVVKVPGVVGVAPFSINPMMLTHGDATATGVLLKGVDPALSLGAGAKPGTIPVLDLPKHIISGQLEGLRLPDAKPPERKFSTSAFDDPDPTWLTSDGGVPDWGARDDAGQPVELLKRIKDAKLPDGSAKDADVRDAGVPEDEDAKVSDKDPKGDVEPDGGYKSVLPTDDEIPADVDPDPCADPSAVKKMPGIVIGITLAKTLDLKLGDCVTVTSPTIGFSYAGGQIKPPVAKRFRVIAEFEQGFDQYDSKLVYTDLYEAQAFYDQGDTVTGVEMKVDDIDQAHAISQRIAQLLASGLYHTMDWEELNHGLFTALTIQQISMSSVLTVIIIVASFTVVATLVMIVFEKKKEIAVLKAMGATDGGVLRIFLYQGGMIGLAGTTLGLLLGLFFCKILVVYGFPLDPKVYFISRLPVLVRWQEFLITAQCALAICLDATILPAIHAADLDPAEGLRDQDSADSVGRGFSRWLTAWIFLGQIFWFGSTVILVMQIEVGGLTADWSIVRLATAVPQPPAVLAATRLLALALALFQASSLLAILLRKRWGLFGFASYLLLTPLMFIAAKHGPLPVVVMSVLGVWVVLRLLTIWRISRHWRTMT